MDLDDDERFRVSGVDPVLIERRPPGGWSTLGWSFDPIPIQGFDTTLSEYPDFNYTQEFSYVWPVPTLDELCGQNRRCRRYYRYWRWYDLSAFGRFERWVSGAYTEAERRWARVAACARYGECDDPDW